MSRGAFNFKKYTITMPIYGKVCVKNSGWRKKFKFLHRSNQRLEMKKLAQTKNLPKNNGVLEFEQNKFTH